jgi:hypothetical protein
MVAASHGAVDVPLTANCVPSSAISLPFFSLLWQRSNENTLLRDSLVDWVVRREDEWWPLTGSAKPPWGPLAFCAARRFFGTETLGFAEKVLVPGIDDEVPLELELLLSAFHAPPLLLLLPPAGGEWPACAGGLCEDDARCRAAAEWMGFSKSISKSSA